MSAPLFAQGMRDSAEQGAIDRQLIGDRVHRKPRGGGPDRRGRPGAAP